VRELAAVLRSVIHDVRDDQPSLDPIVGVFAHRERLV
jgi:hypothetical protein